MRILVSCQHYWPEPFNTGDVCEALVARGHEVTVITALPNTGMPGNDIPAEWRDPSRRDEVHNGVRVLRADLHPRLAGGANRVRNYLSFWGNANKIARGLGDGFDVALGYQLSPVMQADPALVWARKHGKKALVYSFDLWPASLLAGGFKESSLPFKWMRAVSKRIYSQADRLAVTSPLFDEYFRGELGLDIPDSAYLPQYADASFLEEADPATEGFDPTKVNLTFAGNVGHAQSVETIVEAAALLRGDERIAFHVVGSGSCLEACRERAGDLGLGNLTFHGRRPVEDMPSYYAASDGMLLTFAPSPMADYTLPRKATTYLAAGKPVVAALGGETERVLTEAGCGLCCGIADAEGLARACAAFAGMPAGERARMGNAARAYYLDRFTKERFLDTLEGLLSQLSEED